MAKRGHPKSVITHLHNGPFGHTDAWAGRDGWVPGWRAGGPGPGPPAADRSEARERK
jgi:hypothetical protein